MRLVVPSPAARLLRLALVARGPLTAATATATATPAATATATATIKAAGKA